MRTMVRLFEILEDSHGLPAGTFKMETMVEAHRSSWMRKVVTP
jgi:hypothetical protein